MDEFKIITKEFNDLLGRKFSVQIDLSKVGTFEKIIAELVSIKQKYEDKLSQLRTAAEEKIVRLEYSKGEKRFIGDTTVQVQF